MKPFGKDVGAKQGGTDEWYTPREAVEVLLEFIPKGSRILCPFDTAESEYVKVFGKDHTVIHSHISEGIDFFELPKPDVDYVISNPPYSRRNDVIKRLYEWDIPFAMMCNSNGIYDSKTRFELADHKGGQLLFLYPRAKYRGEDNTYTSPPYMSCYWAYKMLPNDLMFRKISEPELPGQIEMCFDEVEV